MSSSGAPEFVEDDQIDRSRDSMILPTVLSARPRYRVVSSVGGVEVGRDLGPARMAAVPRAIGVWVYRVLGGPMIARFCWAGIHSRLEAVEDLGWDRGGGHVEGLQGLGHREPGGFEAVDDVEASRGGQFGLDQGAQHPLGVQRWALAVSRTSGAARRIAASLGRRSLASDRQCGTDSATTLAAWRGGGGHELTSPSMTRLTLYNNVILDLAPLGRLDLAPVALGLGVSGVGESVEGAGFDDLAGEGESVDDGGAESGSVKVWSRPRRVR